MGLYTELRRRNLDSVGNLPIASYFRILDEVYSDELIDVLCKDVIELFQGTRKERQELLHSILLKGDLTKLRVDTLLSALCNLEQPSDNLVVERLTRFAAEHKEKATSKRLTQRLYPLLLKCLQRSRVPSGARSLAYYPPSLVHATFGFIHKLVVLSFDQLAVDLLHFLFDRGFVPSEAIHRSEDLSTVVSSALVRASIHWNWKPLAIKILLHLLRNEQPSEQSLFELAVQTSYALLDAPRNQDICACRYLFIEMHRLAPMPSGLIRKFYNSAAERMQGEEAAAFYFFSRTATLVTQHRYPPPQGTALTWLMHYLVTTSKKVYLSRVLATEVVEDNLPIDPQSRARFITLTASRGYSSLARRLWSRYSIGKDSYLVAGNSALMLRMISLFAHLVRRASSRLRRAKTNAERNVLNCQIHDLVTFRDHVLRSYRRYHGSLSNTTHTIITSYARACFIVGDITEGFKAFSIMLRRKEVPDMYDVNVALSAIAMHQPRLAVSIITRLKNRGTQPDAVSYATVMHYAERHNDSGLVQAMMRHLRSLDRRQLDLKSVAALIRSTLAFNDDETRTLQHRKLQVAMDIIMSLNFLPSPQTGKYLVISSLRVDNPLMAYRFWELLLRESTEWNDHKQVLQRQLIRKKLVEHRQLGWVGDEDVEQMLKKLREQPNT